MRSYLKSKKSIFILAVVVVCLLHHVRAMDCIWASFIFALEVFGASGDW